MISVIVPAYNAQATLQRCLDSILAQTFRDLEVLLIDDGSADGTPAIADACAERDSRVKVFHKENGGLSTARNYGLDRASGDWIAFVDADDRIEENTYETALRHTEQAGAEIGVFGRITETPGASWERRPSKEVEVIDSRQALEKLLVTGELRYAVWDKLYRRDLFEGLRYPEGFNYEDRRTTYRLFQRAQRIVLIPDVLYHYIQYESSIIHSPSLRNRLDHWTASLELFRVFGDDEVFREACLKQCAYSIYHAWGRLWEADAEEAAGEQDRIREMRAFAQEHRGEILRSPECKAHVKAGTALCAAGGRGTMFLANRMIRTQNALNSIRQKRYSRTFSHS